MPKFEVEFEYAPTIMRAHRIIEAKSPKQAEEIAHQLVSEDQIKDVEYSLYPGGEIEVYVLDEVEGEP